MSHALTPPPVLIDPVDVFLNPPDDTLYELVDGKLVEKNMSAISSWVASEIMAFLRDALRRSGEGWVATEIAVMCFPWRKDHGRRPDVAVFRTDRLAGPTEERITVAPNLVVEVLSPNDRSQEVERKVTDYLRAGVDLLWIVNPDTRNVRVHRADGTGQIIAEADTITANPVVSGFSASVRDFFPKPSVST